MIVAIALYLLWPRIIDLTRGPETMVLQAIGELRKAPALKVADTALDFAQAQVDSERDANQLRGWRRDVQKAIAEAEGRAG